MKKRDLMPYQCHTKQHYYYTNCTLKYGLKHLCVSESHLVIINMKLLQVVATTLRILKFTSKKEKLFPIMSILHFEFSSFSACCPSATKCLSYV